MSSIAALWSPLLFGFALFLSAGLLFLVQPMVGRTLLPHLGGNPIAWNACLVFFQATLLAGYVYAGLLHRFRGVRWQPWLQLLLLGAATTLCFTGMFGDQVLGDYAARLDALDTYPVLTTLCLLIVVIGLPYLALAAVSPLVARWFAHLDHPQASDPYFLFVASNLGGLTALVFYPLIIEPHSPLYAQWMAWKLAVIALGVLLFLVAFCVWRSPRNPELEPKAQPTDPNAPLLPVLIGRGPATWSRRLYWLAASAIPVALMMSVTDYLTLDVAPAPILWTLPLALYLLAFSQAFGRFSPLDRGGFSYKLFLQLVLGLFLTLALAVVIAAVVSEQNRGPGVAQAPAAFLAGGFVLILLVPRSWLAVLQPLSVLAVVLLQVNLVPIRGLGVGLVLLHVTCFYLSARLCLGMLAEDRPAATALTTYFNWIGIGGLCGGLFQLVIAPLVFRRDFLEYSLLAALASTLRPAWCPNGLTDWLLCSLPFPNGRAADKPAPLRRRIGFAFDFGFALLAALGIAGLFLLFRKEVRPQGDSLLADFPLIIALFGALVLYVRPLRFGFALAAIVLLSFIGDDGTNNQTLLASQRTAFGILRVKESKKTFRGDAGAANPFGYTERALMQATTYHGNCIIEPPELRRYPTTYYHELGPVGRVMQSTAWFTPPLPPDRGKGPRMDWQQRHRDFASNDARIAASLVGMGATPLVAPLASQLTTAWSEPPYAIVGLGVGSLYCYAHPYQWVDAYELDPAIVALSVEKPPIFPYAAMAQARGVQGQMILGDARRSLSKPGHEFFYQMIFVDAFNSDAIPVHLLTEEALATYFQKLAPEGVLCIHTSNRYVDLPSVLERSAQRLGAAMYVAKDNPDRNEVPGYFSSEWVLLARDQKTLDRHRDIDRFKGDNVAQFQQRPVNVQWTDEHADLLGALRKGQIWPTLIQALLVVILIFGLLLGVIEMAAAMLARPPRR